jgi:SHS family lactate transporter-like MFS transporter
MLSSLPRSAVGLFERKRCRAVNAVATDAAYFHSVLTSALAFLVFVSDAIAAEFGKPLTEIAFAILLTLAMRPVGALLLRRAADR